jgi:hypothetical protein
MTPTEARLQEIEKNAELALKYQSYGNAADACRQDVPYLLALVRKQQAALAEMYHFLNLIDMEWQSDPTSVQCFDSRIIKGVLSALDAFEKGEGEK